MKSNEIPSEEPESERKTTDRPSSSVVEMDAQMVDQLPQIETICKRMLLYSNHYKQQ